MARKTGLKGLQEWAKHVTQGYRDVEIKNMTTSFRNGLAFCAIIHRYRPELIPYDDLKKDNILNNNQLAFSVAESELDIPALLDAEDMVELSVPDKLSVATYLVQYYNYFKDKQPASSGKPLNVVKNVQSATRTPTEAAPSPKKSKVMTSEPAVVTKMPSSPSLPVNKENKTQSATNSILSGTNIQSIRKGRRSKFNKPSEPIETSPPPSKPITLTSTGSENRVSSKRGTMGMEECEVCGERVFLMERLGIENHVFHRACFKCSQCKISLKPGSYEHDSNSDKFYCQQHYREAIRQQTIKRTMVQRGLSPPEESVTKPKRTKKFETPETRDSPVVQKTPEPKKLLESKKSVEPVSMAKKKESPKQSPKETPKQSPRDTPKQSPRETPRQSPKESPKESPAHVHNEGPLKTAMTATVTKPADLKSGLPSLLKTLAANKQQGDNTEQQPTNAHSNTTTTTPVQTKTVEPVKPPRMNRTGNKSPSHVTATTKTQNSSPGHVTTTTKTLNGPPSHVTTTTKTQNSSPGHVTTTTKTLNGPPSHVTTTTKTQNGPPGHVTTSNSQPTSNLPSTTLAWITKEKVKGQTPPGTPKNIPSKPPPPSTVTTKAVEPVKKPFGQVLKPVKPVEKVDKPVEPVEQVTKPFGQVLKPVKPVEKVDKPVEPVEQVNKPFGQVLKPVNKLVQPTPVTPFSTTNDTPVKPPRHKKTTPTVQSPEVKGDIPSKRPSVKPKRPAPPRPSHPPSIRRKDQNKDLGVLSDKRKRRVGVLRRRLEDVEKDHNKLEEKGVKLEQQLREKDSDGDDHLMEEWFALVNEKNLLVRQESDLVYELRDLELIEQHEVLEAEIHKRLAKNDSHKSEMEKLEEEAMITELVELVEKRDKLLWTLHLEKTLDDEEDRQVELMASTQGYSVPKLQKNKSAFY